MTDLAGRHALPWGYVDVVTNEITVASTVEDPPKVRMGATAGGSLGCVSFNRVRADGVQDEVALLQGKIDERYRSLADGGTAQQTELVGEFRFDIKKPQRDGETDDKATVPVLQLQHDRIVVHKPMVDPQGNRIAAGSSMPSAPTRMTRFYSDGGKFCVNVQDDTGVPRFVVYRVLEGRPESEWPFVGVREFL